MKLVLSFVILALIGLQTFSLDASIAPGLSLKNLMLYAAALTIVVRLALLHRLRIEIPGLQISFVFLLAYATVSWLVALLAMQYPGYGPVELAWLKINLYDHFIFFFVFFYGMQSLEDSLSVTDALLFGVVIANIITVLDASGILGLGIIPVRTENIEEIGRVQGAFGEANQHAAVVVMLLPATCAKVALTKGPWRAFWLAGVGFAVAAVLMTVSRGAMVGLALASLWGIFIFRRFFSFGRIAKWVGLSTLILSVVIVALSANYTDLLIERLFGLSFSLNSGDASSGRTLMWAAVIQRMLESPWSLLVGFGWNTIPLMFDSPPHNTYLGWWFTLGLPGLIAFLLIIANALFAARTAAEVAAPNVRPYMVGFVIGFMAVCVSIFFVELTVPWTYVWAYVGLSMRAAVAARGLAESPVPRMSDAQQAPALRRRPVPRAGSAIARRTR